MVKFILIISVMLLSVCAYAQIPDGYYDLANNKTGEELKSSLYSIIKNHVEFPYTSSNTDTWDVLKESDRDTANSENVILLYSGWSVNAAQEYNSAKGWNREHVWAKSHGDFGTTMGAGTDLHHLRPCDISVNSARNNKDFDNGGTVYVDGDGTTHCKSDADSWEPRDEVKGDVARMLFYMAVRYQGENGEPNLALIDQVESYDLNESEKGFHGKFSILLSWHKSDPVDSFEENRNNIIYSYQKNRNPFIDNPEYADQIWITTSISTPKESELLAFPNPVNNYLTIKGRETEAIQVQIYSTQGKLLKEVEIMGQTKIAVNDLTSGTYFLKLNSGNEIITSKFVVLR